MGITARRIQDQPEMGGFEGLLGEAGPVHFRRRAVSRPGRRRLHRTKWFRYERWRRTPDSETVEPLVPDEQYLQRSVRTVASIPRLRIQCCFRNCLFFSREIRPQTEKIARNT